jgi:hypothetical protein
MRGSCLVACLNCARDRRDSLETTPDGCYAEIVTLGQGPPGLPNSFVCYMGQPQLGKQESCGVFDSTLI